jgi:menaquinol-cytochrome c reductase iron-sulfur subunit
MGVLSGGEGTRPAGDSQPSHPAAMEPPTLSTRRSFFGVLVGSISAVVGAMMAVPLVRFALHPVLHGGGGADWFALGSPEELATAAAAEPLRAEVSFRRVDGWRATTVKQTVWVTRGAAGGLVVLSATCPHLGCVAVWRGDRGRFVCPCHNGNFDRHGEVLSGPPPRGLDPLPVKLEGGKLWVKYRYYRPLVRDREVIG